MLVAKLDIEIDKPLLVNNIVTCTGADTCRLGICLSKGLAAAIRRKLLKTKADLDKIPEFQLHVSGCPNSCGRQLWADLGFSGAAMRNDRLYPAYRVYAGASRGRDPRLAEVIGTLNARDIPGLVDVVLNDYTEKKIVTVASGNISKVKGKNLLRNILRVIKKYLIFQKIRIIIMTGELTHRSALRNAGPANVRQAYSI